MGHMVTQTSSTNRRFTRVVMIVSAWDIARDFALRVELGFGVTVIGP